MVFCTFVYRLLSYRPSTVVVIPLCPNWTKVAAAFLIIGWVYYKLGDYQTAIQHLSQVVEKMPDVNVFNYHLGMAYYKKGDKARAKEQLEKALSLSDDFDVAEEAKKILAEL